MLFSCVSDGSTRFPKFVSLTMIRSWLSLYCKMESLRPFTCLSVCASTSTRIRDLSFVLKCLLSDSCLSRLRIAFCVSLVGVTVPKALFLPYVESFLSRKCLLVIVLYELLRSPPICLALSTFYKRMVSARSSKVETCLTEETSGEDSPTCCSLLRSVRGAALYSPSITISISLNL